MFDKDDVNYRKARDGDESCRMCVYFIPGDHQDKPGTCELVNGMIRPDDTSDLFERK